jgi:hypothetical protein
MNESNRNMIKTKYEDYKSNESISIDNTIVKS